MDHINLIFLMFKHLLIVILLILEYVFLYPLLKVNIVFYSIYVNHLIKFLFTHLFLIYFIYYQSINFILFDLIIMIDLFLFFKFNC